MRPLALAILLSACGPPGFADLPRPATTLYIDEGGGGICGSYYAVDATGGVWTGRDCAGDHRPLALVAQASDTDAADVSTRLDAVLALPDDADCRSPTWSGFRYRFRRTLPGTNDWPEKELCAPTIAPEGDELIQLMMSLAHAP